MHRSPAEPNPALTAASAARSRSASGSTTMWFFAPPSACTRLPARVPRLVDVARDRRRADERHRLDVGVLEQRVDRDLVAVHDVEHAGREPGFGPQLREPVGRRRILLARLEHDGVARRDRDREEPARHHRREVERADDRDDAERLAQRVHVDAATTRLRSSRPSAAAGRRTRTRRPRARARPRRARRSSTLPCSAVMIAASSSARCVQQLAEAEQHLRALGRATSCATSRTRRRAAATAASTSSATRTRRAW